MVIGLIPDHFENRVPVLGGGGGAVLHHHITAHEQAQLNRVCCFPSLMCSLHPEDLHSELIRLTHMCALIIATDLLSYVQL